MKRYDKVIFLCTTNTLLSPLAECIFRKNSPDWMPEAVSRGLVVLFEEPVNPKMNVLLSQNGFSVSNHGMSKQIAAEELTEDTLILTMTLSEKVKFIEEFHYENYVYTLGEYVGVEADLIDPVGGEEEQYKECFDEIVFRVNKAIHKIEEQYWEE